MSKMIKDSKKGFTYTMEDYMFKVHMSEDGVLALVKDSPDLSIVGEEDKAPVEKRDEEPVVKEKPRGFPPRNETLTQKGVTK
jgi:hypothetical protein